MDGEGEHVEGHEARVHAPAQLHAQALSFAGLGKEPRAKAKDLIAERGSYAGLAQSNQHQSGASGLAPDSATPCSAQSPLSLDSNRVT